MGQALKGSDKVEGAGISIGGHSLADLGYTDGMTPFAQPPKQCSEYWSL